ncbi:VOC family protein [Methylobrevis pamukkalensis]|uniref:Glyoxalase-like domain-containing protein n=1 Tax=Methylobrevis pamukkalensis TaxID=1439726 RepID=A0A1E3H5M9_9HYPH|nr:VOC family protein [Methylobrevis pamukkalensis]ODN71106.1 hypothetical protein A6302_01539 [Methylobrevis pamukkalensis]
MARGIDHLVLPVRDLRATREFYRALGFTVTPVNWHPFGTMNSLVQFDGAFLELLSVADDSAISPGDDETFSFAAFNRDFLKHREGLSMLVLESAGTAADRADFAAAGLRTYAPFRFVRDARRPDGSTRTVAFSLTFTSSDAMPDAGFFTCEQHFPENFWTPEFQDHANGATGIAAVVMVAADPASVSPFLAAFAGAEAVDARGGIAFDTGRGELRISTPAAFCDVFGPDALPEAPGTPRFAAIVLGGTDRSAMAERLDAAQIPFGRAPADGALVIAPSAAFGVALILA